MGLPITAPDKNPPQQTGILNGLSATVWPLMYPNKIELASSIPLWYVTCSSLKIFPLLSVYIFGYVNVVEGLSTMLCIFIVVSVWSPIEHSLASRSTFDL